MDYERILLVKPEVFIYKIPPRTSARGYRAADWNLDKPDWTLRLRIIAKDKKCLIRLEDKSSGELFGECPVDSYPGNAVESVSDSSRYFVLRIQDPSGRSAFLGLGYGDRSDSFDMNVSLQDHFKWVLTSEQIVKEDAAGVDSKPKLDLAFKEGQMIKINIGKKSSTTTGATGSLNSGAAIPSLLPPPPSGAVSVNRLAGPPAAPAKKPPATAPDLPARPMAVKDLPKEGSGLLDFDPIPSNANATSGAVNASANHEWGDYKSSTSTNPAATDDSWMNF
ncbi:NECAP-like protein [Hypsibius exemplaris]|uniref:NECAP-like protein n=1 Tax=Hypsibius exemplaris TaxID=2072580 RepID=A0A9X6NHM1_HYPEX|nr:NECAP-like protein [Hypsibius exemplaris]